MNGAPGRTLPLGVCIGWGFGSLGVATVFAITNLLALAYMTDVMGIGAATAGVLLAGVKAYDIFADVGIGWLSDRTQSRWGRRRPYLLIGGVFLALSPIVIFGSGPFAAPWNGVAYMAFALIFYFSAYSAFNVPYMAMPAEMTDDYHERSRLISFRVVAISIATVIGSALGTYLVGRFGGGVPGHRAMALFIGVVVLISAAVSFVFSAGAPFTTRHETTHLSLGAQWRLVFQNRPFFVLMAVKFCGLINYGFWAVFPYMFTRVLKQPYTVLGTYFAINSLTMIVVQPFWLALGRRYSKKALLAASSLCFGLIYFTWLWAGPGDPVWTIWVRALALGIVGGGSLLMSQALLPDAIEHDRRQTGLSREGIFAGIYTTVEKAAGAIGSGIAGIFLGAMGYVQSQGGDVEQPHSAIVAIYISTAVFPAVLTCIGVAVLLLFYDLKPTTRAAGIQTA